MVANALGRGDKSRAGAVAMIRCGPGFWTIWEVWCTGLTDDLTHDKRGVEDDSKVDKMRVLGAGAIVLFDMPRPIRPQVGMCRRV